MKADERRVKYFDFHLAASVRVGKNGSVGVTPASLLTVLRLLKASVAAGTVHEFKSVGDIQSWTIEDVEINSAATHATVLITRSDRLSADQSIANMRSRAMRVAKKLSLEGNAYSSHLAFKLSPAQPNLYPLLMEEALGISSDHVQRLFARAIRDLRQAGASAFLYPHPSGAVDKDGNPRMLQGVYQCEITGHPSLDFIYELNNGELEGIELVQAAPTRKNWDTYNATEAIAEVVRLRPLGSPKPHIEIVKSICAAAKQAKMSEVRIRFTDTHEAQHNVALDPSDVTLINEDRFIKKDYLRNFNSRLDTGYKKVHPEIRDKMYYLLR